MVGPNPMPAPDDANLIPLELRSISDAVVSLMVRPAAFVADGEMVVARNAGWMRVTGCRECSSGLPTLSECLREFSGHEGLLIPLRAGSQSVGAITLYGPHRPASPEEPRRGEYVARWRQVETSSPCRTCAMVILEEPSEVENLVSVINSQRVRINHLLIRQTLIEEKERRRLGRAMHDGIVQDLAEIRARIARDTQPGRDTASLVCELDTIIKGLRDMAFELSPPVLEDLGLRPALHWLAEYLGQRYGTRVEVADDAREPPLPPPARTIVFRAVRELAINAAKHAAGADIVLTCVTNDRTTRLAIRDTGPGFNTAEVRQSTDGFDQYGLLSVEQQIRGIGGSFELVSTVGEGTRAAITVPLDRNKDDARA
jgi:signal transduction histidine kinase